MSKRKSTEAEKGVAKQPRTIQTTVFKYFQTSEKPSLSQKQASEKPASSQKHATTIAESPKALGIQHYSKKEIESSSGLQRDYRIFWNHKAEELCADPSVRVKLRNKAAIRGAIDCSWTVHKSSILQLQAEKMIEQTKLLYSDEVVHSHELSTVTKNVERMLQACTSVHLSYTQIEIAASVEEKLILEKELEKEFSELKKAQAALLKAMKERSKILEAEEMDELMTTGSPVQLNDYELESLVEVIKEESKHECEYVSDSEESNPPESPEIPLMLPGLK